MKSAPLLVALLALSCSKSTSSSSTAVTGGIGPAGGGTAQAGADTTAGGNGAGAAGDGMSGAVAGSASAPATAPDNYDDSGCEHPAVAKDCKDGWCKVPPGCFIMGSPEQEWGHPPQEKRVKVTLTRGFLIGQHEVTNQQWASFKLTNPGRVIDSVAARLGSRGVNGACPEASSRLLRVPLGAYGRLADAERAADTRAPAAVTVPDDGDSDGEVARGSPCSVSEPSCPGGRADSPVSPNNQERMGISKVRCAARAVQSL